MSFRNTSVSLSEHFVEFANRQVSEGRYGSISEVVRAGLRLLEEREQQLLTLKKALAEGEASGIVTDFDFDTFIGEIGQSEWISLRISKRMFPTKSGA
jgi:antitoxin ParD1/3/4